MSLRALVIEVGARLGRSASDVGPFIQSLQENWYDSVDSLIDASADDLASVGLPRRFAVELAAAAPGFRGGGGGGERGGKGKDRDRKGSSKGKGKDDDDRDRKGGKGKSRGGRSSGEIHATVPIDLTDIDPEFVFRPKLLGKSGSHVHHIQDQTGVSVELKGMDPEGYLEFALTAADDRSLDRAVSMCEDLVNTVFDEYEEFANRGGRGGKGGKSRGKGDRDGKGKKGKSKGKGKKGKRAPEEGDIEERIPIDTEGIDPDFYLRGKLVGQDGVNVKHIEKETGCSVQVERDDGQGMAFLIHGKDEAAVGAARDMCEDLLSNVLEDAGATPPAAKRSREEKGGKGKGKKGKGKGRKNEDGERPHKAARTDE